MTMRIGIDNRLRYYQRAGIARYTFHLATALLEIDSADEFLIFRHWRDRPVFGQFNGQEPPLFTPCHHRWEQTMLPIELAWRRLDCLHSPDFIPPLRRSCPAVITIHDLAFLREPDLLTAESRRYYGQVPLAVASAEAIIAVSGSTRDDLVRMLGVAPDRIDVIYEAADRHFRPLAQTEIPTALSDRIAELGRYLLFVGTVEPRKNLPVVLEAMSRIDPVSLPCRLVIAGSRGWLDDEVDATIDRLGLGERVIFWGRADSVELVSLYNQAQALVLPSRYEGFGLPALEAMACGTPVIASNTGALPEIIVDAGILCDPIDVDAWTTAIETVLSDVELSDELRQRGLTRAKAFSWQRAAEQTLDVYRKAVRR